MRGICATYFFHLSVLKFKLKFSNSLTADFPETGLLIQFCVSAKYDGKIILI